MSRHRRQRLRRFNRSLDRVPKSTLLQISARYFMTGRFPTWATPRELLAFKRRVLQQ